MPRDRPGVRPRGGQLRGTPSPFTQSARQPYCHPTWKVTQVPQETTGLGSRPGNPAATELLSRQTSEDSPYSPEGTRSGPAHDRAAPVPLLLGSPLPGKVPRGRIRGPKSGPSRQPEPAQAQGAGPGGTANPPAPPREGTPRGSSTSANHTANVEEPQPCPFTSGCGHVLLQTISTLCEPESSW